jgi:hypothetical protein
MPICTIVGTIKDSGGNPLSGKLTYVLDSAIRDDSTTPDSLHVPEPVDYIVSSGVVNLPLEESETDRVSYHFRFYKQTAPGPPAVYATTPVKGLDFHAVVSNTPTYEWASLAANTGIVTENLATGAVRVAREILTNPALAALITDATRLYRSLTPPPGLTNAVWIKPDTGDVFLWDGGRSLWITFPQEVNVFARNVSASANVLLPVPLRLADTAQTIIHEVRIRSAIQNPTNSTNRWDIQPLRQDTTAASATPFGSLISTASDPTTAVRRTQSFNQLLAANQMDSLGLQLTRVGAPGNLLSIAATYRVSFTA